MAFNAGDIVAHLKLDSNNFNNGVNKAQHSAGIFSGALGKIGIAATAATAATAALAIPLALIGKNAVSSASEYQQARIAFETMLGSADKAKIMLKDITQFAKKTPFELPQVVEGAKALLAYGIEAEKIIPTFEALGNIAAGVGKDKMPQLTLAFGQVRAAGKLTGQELRQFTESGVPLLEVLAQQSGRTAAQVKEDMENGLAPSFKEVEAALFSMSAEGGKFEDLMVKQSQTFSGRISNIKDSIGQTLREIVGITTEGEVKEGSIFDKLSKSAEKLMVWLEENKETIIATAIAIFDGLSSGISKVYNWITISLIPALQRMYTWWNTYIRPVLEVISNFIRDQLMAAFRDLKSAMEQNNITFQQLKPILTAVGIVILLLVAPVLALIAAAVALIIVVIRVIGWIALLQAKMNAFGQSVRSTIGGAFDWVKAKLSEAWNAIVAAVTNGVARVTGKIAEIKSKIMSILSGAGRWLYDAGKSIMEGLLNGIKDGFEKVKEFASGIADKIKSLKGPLPQDKILLIDEGNAIMEGLNKGIMQGFGQVAHTVSGIGGAIGAGVMGGAGNVNRTTNFGTVNISKEVDASNLLRQITREDELTGFGLTGVRRA